MSADVGSADSSDRRNTRVFRELRWCDGRPGSAAADGEAGAVRAADRAGRLERGGVPDRRGATRETGKRWRHGRTITSGRGRRLHYPPVIAARKAEISPRYLSEDERVRIADLRRAGHGRAGDRRAVGRSPSTVSRELRRNRDPGSGQYRPFAAQRLAARRRARPGRGKLMRRRRAARVRGAGLEKRWSPEQISPGAAPSSSPDDPERHLVHETIYQAIYRPELGGLRRDLPGVAADRPAATQTAPPRRMRAGPGAGRHDDDRPAPGRGRRPERSRALGGRPDHRRRQPVGDRHAGRTALSRFTILLHLPGGRHTAEDVRDALVARDGAAAARRCAGR